MIRIRQLLFFGLVILGLSWGSSAWAQNTVAVTASVQSAVSASQSSLVADVQTVPADGSSRVTLTATLVDNGNNPVADSVVKVSSNRGNVDTVLCYQGGTLTSADHATSDADSIVRCVATSNAPGQATFSAIVDEQTTLDDKPIVTFTALPILQNLTVTVTLPSGKKLTLFQPPSQPSTVATTPKGIEPSHRSGAGQLVSTGINVSLSFWTFLLIIFFIVLTPLLFLWILLLLRRLRAQERDQLAKVLAVEEKIAQEEQVIDSKLPPPTP